MRHLRIGIPRGLLFHSHADTWKRLFNSLGCEVIVSPETNAEILREGIRHAVGDLCLPLKTFLGHAAALRESVDLLFIPRYVSIEQESYLCPKMIGLPDVVRATFSSLPPVLDPIFHVKQFGDGAIPEFTRPIAQALGLSGEAAAAAYRTAAAESCEVPDERHRHFSAKLAGAGGAADRIRIGIIGRPYLLFDRHLSKDLFAFLERSGVTPVFLRPSAEEIREAMAVIPKWVYWDMGKEVVAAAHMLFLDRRIDGVINVCSAACGPDSFTGDLIRKRLNQRNRPYMALSLDEHASDVGIQTRVEAFVDMIGRVTA